MYYNRVGRRRRVVRTCATQSQRVTSQDNSVAVNKLYHHQVKGSKVETWRRVAILPVGAGTGVRLVGNGRLPRKLLARQYSRDALSLSGALRYGGVLIFLFSHARIQSCLDVAAGSICVKWAALIGLHIAGDRRGRFRATIHSLDLHSSSNCCKRT